MSTLTVDILHTQYTVDMSTLTVDMSTQSVDMSTVTVDVFLYILTRVLVLHEGHELYPLPAHDVLVLHLRLDLDLLDLLPHLVRLAVLRLVLPLPRVSRAAPTLGRQGVRNTEQRRVLLAPRPRAEGSPLLRCSPSCRRSSVR